MDTNKGKLNLAETRAQIHFKNSELANIERLGLIRQEIINLPGFGSVPIKIEAARYNPLMDELRQYDLTDFGFDFLKAYSE